VGRIEELEIDAQPIERFASVVGPEVFAEAKGTAETIRRLFKGRVFWNVNSTGLGGGVAEMLRPLIAYARGLGVDTRWLVLRGNEQFFRITKRLHHALHGSDGDGTELGDAAHRVYAETLREVGEELRARVRPRDVILLHDPQTAGLAPYLTDSGAVLVWRCHIGHDTPGPEVTRGWRFLAPYLEHVPAFVFSRDSYVPEFCDQGKSTIIRPSIDVFSPKNQELPNGALQEILVHTGLVEAPDGRGPTPPDHTFVREDGTPGRVEHRADLLRHGRPPRWETNTIVQVSRWDPLKDPLGVMRGFAKLVEGGCPGRAELILAGPNPRGVADDPEGESVFDLVVRAWGAYPARLRNRIHIASLPMEDLQENAAIVNALQRHATVVVQKSLHEGFGLTITEAMWKRRPVVASAVGGIQDQIEHGVNGLLIQDPTDLDAFADALRRLFDHPADAARLGEAGQERVRERFLGIRHLVEYGRLIERLG
jgi:trehalose synthase